jgi:protein-S-isoprenylcysteine O-methyltransferase Ste14
MRIPVCGAIASSALKILANAVVVVALVLLAYTCFQKFDQSGSLNWLGLLIVNLLMVTMYVARRDATAICASARLWVLAFAGTCLPLAMRPTETIGFGAFGTAVQLAGMGGIIASMLSLRRSFGIVPANRGIRTRGLYKFVRHPLYASELLVLLGIALVNPSAWNFGLFIGDCVLQFLRATAEERFLSKDPVYSEYRARVRYQLVPLVL